MLDFTPTQGRYLSYISAYIDGFGLPPAESEIAEAMEVSPPSANQMMKKLESKGLIRRQAGVPRSIELLVSPDQIPKWTGKRLTRMVKEWVKTKPRTLDIQTTTTSKRETQPQRSTLANVSAGNQMVYQFKITLNDSKPAIWRRIETRDITLEEFHELIQLAMGWTDSHLHQFEIGGVRYVDPQSFDDAIPDPSEKLYTEIRISDLVRQAGPKLRMIYRYDFGDNWEHTVALEKSSLLQADGTHYPRCLAGQRACPPEDVGGIWGYENYLEAISDPEHEEHADYIEWGGDFDPDAFSPELVTDEMRAIK